MKNTNEEMYSKERILYKDTLYWGFAREQKYSSFAVIDTDQ